jgi:D-alanyl-D-alanine carboxypeptidase/D-alanyl-D-alanine-endopeptidase (penicillin-binding protein 4)
MRRIIAILFLFILHTFPALAAIDTDSFKEIIQNSRIPSADLGILVEEGDREVFAMNPDRKFVPASLTKILTGAAAYEILNADHLFKTLLLTDGTVAKGVLRGSLYLQGGGDPSFSSRKLATLAGQLKGKGIRNIEGSIVIDNSRFDDPVFDNLQEARDYVGSWDRIGYPVFFTVKPTSELKALLAKGPRYESRIRTITAPTKNRDYVIYRNMNQPDLWTGIQFQELLKKQKIVFRGKIIKGKTPSEATMLAEISSPLKNLVSHMMKMSSNYYAEMLTKNLAAEGSRKPANIQTGIDQIRLFMDHVGITRSDYNLRSAAGFSRQNHISPRGINLVLEHIRKIDQKFELFKSSLSIAGVDGTLRHRMRNTAAHRRIVAKTGYLAKTDEYDNVVGLAGYALREDGRILTFTYIYNGPKASSQIRSLFDLLSIELVRSHKSLTFASLGGYGMHFTM